MQQPKIIVAIVFFAITLFELVFFAIYFVRGENSPMSTEKGVIRKLQNSRLILSNLVPSDKSRNREVDILKGMAIILMVIGHTPSPSLLGNYIIEYIYTFHVPIFFIISGYMMFNRENGGIGRFILRKIGTIIYPYTIFFLLTILYNYTIYPFMQGIPIFSYDFNLKDVVLAFIFSGDFIEKAHFFNGPLWFLPMMFISVILFFLILKVRSNKILFSLIIVSVIILSVQVFKLSPGKHLFWDVKSVLASVVFMAIGYGYCYLKGRFDLSANSWLGILCITIGIIFAQYYHGNLFGFDSYIFYFFASVSAYGYYSFACESNNRILQFIGYNSVIYLGVHILASISLQTMGMELLLKETSFDGVVVYFFRIFAIMFVSIIFVLVYHRVSCLLGILKQTFVH